MPRRSVWTHAQDSQIRRRRAEGAGWDTIAAELSIAMRFVVARGRRIGVPESDDGLRPLSDPDREPLPPGHPETWGVITAGTVLHGARYPLRFFPR